MTTVSIITVSYNSTETIQDTIDSIRRQSYPHTEYIVVDGCSTDGTVDILKENDAVIDRWVSEPDDGVYDAMNKGVRMSTGDIIGILNSDDWYEPEAVETVVRAFEDHDDVDLVHGALNIWDEEGQLHARYGRKDGLPAEFVAPFNHPTCFVRRRVYESLGTFALDLPTAADYDFMLRFLRSGRKDIYIDDVLTNFRQGGASTEYALSPYRQLWRLLRRNGWGPLTSIGALSYRGIRDLAAYVIDRLSLTGVRERIRRFVPYQT